MQAKAGLESVIARVCARHVMPHALEERTDSRGKLDFVVDDYDRGHATVRI